MATEGGHDAIYDYCCTPCEGKKLNAEAHFYCKDCSQLLCGTCEIFHDKFFRRHTVFGRKEVTKWEDVKPVGLLCDEHPGKELEMYCEDHDIVCCHICISVNHRICKKVKPVSNVSKGIRNEPEFKSFLSKAVKTQFILKTLHNKQDNNIQMLQKARRDITSTFKNMKTKLNQIIDRLEEDSVTELDRLLTLLNEKVTSDEDVCSNLLNKIQKILDDIQNLGKQCDELAFQGFKICSEKIASADKLLSSMQDIDYQLEFTPNVNIEHYLSSLETLGNFQVTPPIVNKKIYNVKTSGDSDICWVLGMCHLPNGQTAIAEYNNTKVKLLSAATYCVIAELKLPPYPQDICHTTGTGLAVIVSEYKDNRFIRKEIQFINVVNGKLLRTRTAQLDHECGGIACHNDQLYVGTNNALYVYHLSGKKIKKLFENTPSEYSSVTRFCLGDDGSRIYVTNLDQHLLLTLNSSGQLLSTFRDPELRWPTGVCVADNSSVFVCGQGSHTVIQVDREGKRKKATLATENDGVYGPQCMCYDRKAHTLLIGQYKTDNLLALQLK